MADEAANRTEPATAKRRSQARKEGQVARSPEVAPVAELFWVFIAASFAAPALVARFRHVFVEWLAAAGPMVAANEDLGGAVAALAGRSLADVGALVVPLMVSTVLVGSGSVLAQVGWEVHAETVLPDFNRLNLANGMKRLVSLDAGMNLVKSIAKIAIVLAVAYGVVRHVVSDAIAAPGMSLEDLFSFTADGLGRLVLRMAAVLTVLAALDYAWHRWRYEETLKMTKQEVKEEMKEAEGDPQIKVRFRRAHREIAKRRMLDEVKRADVVLTNPVHVAVALRYRATEMGAPQVIAKGAGEMAQKIKELARAAGVPIVERRALARALFRSVKLGAEIPPALYRAVAEILAYIYSLRGTPAGEGR
jgi:flagellar biosynthesis protein FlhB